MEHNIGVGLIVGLALASSIYVWNNDEFSKEQKIGLLICVIFPPAQWLGILIILAYNSNKESNSAEKAEERKIAENKVKLDSTISALTELKEKGILTEEEYKTKVDKVEIEKAEQNLKNSSEYKQLKNLFDSEVLTKDEFEIKIQILQNISKKEDIKEINNITKADSEIYLNNTEDIKIVKQKSKTDKVFEFVIYIALAFFIFSVLIEIFSR